MKHYQPTKKSKNDRTGFFIALAICLVAVGAAMWSAYTGIGDLLSEDDDEVTATVSATAPVAQQVTGVTEPATEPSETAATEPKTKRKSMALYETSTLPEGEEYEAMQEDLDSLQAVLKVADSLGYPTKNHNVIKQYSEDAVFSKTMKDYRAHTGCDFSADEGDSVYAMCDGVVKNINVSDLYGMTVQIDSQDFSVYYSGLSTTLNVDLGSEVKQGDTIGTVSAIPCESEDDPHVHVEIRVSDKLIDPMTVIGNNE